MSTPSLFSRIIARPRPLWVIVAVSLLLFLMPIGVILLDGSWDVFLTGSWRALMVPSVVIVYITIAAQLMLRSECLVLKAFRPVVLVSDDEFDRIVQDASHTSRAGEVIAFGIGAVIGFGLGAYWLVIASTIWLRIYGPLSQSLMMGMVGWVIYDSISGTRLIAELHRQPLQVDLQNIEPFEPMGRQSLAVALVFAGGILLGAVFGLNVKSIYFWLFFLPLVFVPVLVFFLSMRHTHRVLAGEKKRQLQMAAQKINQTSRAIQSLIAREESLGDLAVEYTALIAYEARLRTVPTWPYNTAMLRTVFFSVLVPVLARGLSVLLFGQ